jgi:hypothetical protein
MRPLQFVLGDKIKSQMNTDFQVAYPRSSAVNFIVPTCNVTVSTIR